MSRKIMKNVVKIGLEKFGEKMDNKLCPLILYQPKSAKKCKAFSNDNKHKEK